MYFTEGWIVNASSESSQIRVKLIVLSLLIIHFVSIFFFHITGDDIQIDERYK